MKFLLPAFITCLASACPSVIAVDVTIPHGTDVPTTASRQHTITPWIDATAVAPCAAGGDRPAKALDIAAMALARTFWSGNPKVKADLVAAAKAAIAAGSQDPMVAYIAARFADLPPARQGELLGQNDARFVGSAYPGFRRFLNDWYRYDIVSHAHPADAAAVADAGAALIDHGITSLAGLDDADAGTEIATAELYIKMVRTFDDDPAVATRWLGELAKPGIPPWWRGLLEGQIHLDLAGQARGGWNSAAIPTDADKAMMRAELALARASLGAAWDLRPERPEPAALMITVSMGCGSYDDCVTWFNRAVAVQMDYPAAYSALSFASRPRWGGSYARMFALGQAGLATGRFDSKAPWAAVDAVFNVFHDATATNTDIHNVLTAQVYQDSCAVLDAYGRFTPRTDAKWDSTCLACLAAACFQYQACIDHIDAAGPNPPLYWFNQFGCPPDQMRAWAVEGIEKYSGGAKPDPSPAKPSTSDF
jgi:hypothetical protein